MATERFRTPPSETRQMAEDEVRGAGASSGALGVLLLLLAVAVLVAVFVFTR